MMWNEDFEGLFIVMYFNKILAQQFDNIYQKYLKLKYVLNHSLQVLE